MLKSVGIILASFGVIGLGLWGNPLFSMTMQVLTLAILASVNYVFLKSLFKNRVPVITRYAYLIDGELSEKRLRYTRFVTQIWGIVFTLFIIIKLVWLFYQLQSWTPPPLLVYMQFSLFAGLGLLFVGEYALRQHLFPQQKETDQTEDTFLSFLKKVASIPIKEVFRNDFVKPENRLKRHP